MPIDPIQQQATPQQNQIQARHNGRPQRTDGTDAATSTQQDGAQAVETEKDAERIERLLADEIQQGLVEVDQRNEIITIRIREHGSFASGRAELIEPFASVLDKIVRALEITLGRVVLAGHTDRRPTGNCPRPGL